MPEERGYLRQTRPQAGAALPAVSAESYGAGFGRVLEDVGERAHRQQLRGYAIERQRTQDAEWSRFQHDFGTVRDEIDGITREARKSGEPGHAERVREQYEARRAALLEGITEDSVRQRATAQFEEWGNRLHSNEADFEEVKRSERVVNDTEAFLDLGDNRIRRLESHDDYLAESELRHDYIDGLNLADDLKAKLHREVDQRGAIAFVRGTLDRDPALAKSMLAEGLFDTLLTPEQTNALLNNADVEIRSLAVAQAREQAAQAAVVKEQVNTLLELDRQGVTIADEDLAAAEAAVGALGDDSLAAKVAGVRANAAFARVYERATPLQREGRMAELAGMAQRTAAEDRELKWLQDHAAGLDRAFEADPVRALSQYGSPAPAIDFADPASIERRAAWARAQSAATGRIVPALSRAEANAIGEQYREGGRGGAVAAMDALAQLPEDQAAAAARMVDPNDPRLAVMVVLPREYRNLALRGRDALKANPKLTSTADLAPDEAEQFELLDARFAEALRAVPPAQRSAILRVAGNIAAGSLDENGGTTMTPDLYWKALNMALGATGTGADRRGGVAGWNDHWFALPEGVTRQAFVNGVQAAAREGIGEGKVKPVNPDGSPAALSRAFPVLVGDGIYEFHTSSGAAVRGSDGRPWRVRVRGDR